MRSLNFLIRCLCDGRYAAANRTRRFVEFLWIPALFLTLLTAPGNAGAAPRIGDRVPAVTLAGLNGAVIRIDEGLRGKVLILHFWRIGCTSCQLEMPAMDLLYRDYRSRGLEILAVNVGQDKGRVSTFASELKVSYPLLIDPDEKGAGIFGVNDVPRTYVIDRKGVIQYRIIGGATPEMLKKMILSLL
jgi:peroxiredoxin